MKRILYLAALALAFPLLASAQGTVNDLETDFGTRSSVGIDYRIAKGFHVDLGYELRTEDYLTKIDRHQASLGLSYKFNDWLKGGVGYTYIYRQGSSAWEPRHRADAHVTFGYRFGNWRLSLKEQLRFTHKTQDLNPYQEVRNALALKSRLKLQYKGWEKIEPYGYVELRNTLNDPACSATWSTSSKAYTDYTFLGYNAIYVNRVRGALGVEWSLSKHHGLDIYALMDYCYDKDIDTNKAGTKLKSLTWDRTFMPTVGIGYIFSF